MKNALATLLFLFPILMGVGGDQNPALANDEQNSIEENTDPMNDTLVIKIGNKEFTATLLDNPTATAFKSMLPLTMNMTELNGNEKYFIAPVEPNQRLVKAIAFKADGKVEYTFTLDKEVLNGILLDDVKTGSATSVTLTVSRTERVVVKDDQ